MPICSPPVTQTRARVRNFHPMATAAAAVCTAGALLAATACSSDSGGSSATSAAMSAADLDAAAGLAGCTPTDQELIELDPAGGDEPVVRVPMPAGWERSTRLDSELIRATLGGTEYGTEDGGPVVMVIVEDIGAYVDTAQEGIDAEIAPMESFGMEIIGRKPTTVCGLPAERVTGLSPAPTGEMIPMEVLVAVYETDTDMYAVLLNAQAPDGVDPQALRDQQAMLEQVQILPSGGRV